METAKSNFGGGNTHWEEKNLGSYAFRYLYIAVCNEVSGDMFTLVV